MATVEHPRSLCPIAPAVIWRDPPARAPHGYWDAVLAEVATRPGTWACIRSYGAGRTAWETARKLRHRYPSYQFRGAKLADGTGEVYARYCAEAAA